MYILVLIGILLGCVQALSSKRGTPEPDTEAAAALLALSTELQIRLTPQQLVAAAAAAAGNMPTRPLSRLAGAASNRDMKRVPTSPGLQVCQQEAPMKRVASCSRLPVQAIQQQAAQQQQQQASVVDMLQCQQSNHHSLLQSDQLDVSGMTAFSQQQSGNIMQQGSFENAVMRQLQEQQAKQQFDIYLQQQQQEQLLSPFMVHSDPNLASLQQQSADAVMNRLSADAAAVAAALQQQGADMQQHSSVSGQFNDAMMQLVADADTMHSLDLSCTQRGNSTVSASVHLKLNQVDNGDRLSAIDMPALSITPLNSTSLQEAQAQQQQSQQQALQQQQQYHSMKQQVALIQHQAGMQARAEGQPRTTNQQIVTLSQTAVKYSAVQQQTQAYLSQMAQQQQVVLVNASSQEQACEASFISNQLRGLAHGRSQPFYRVASEPPMALQLLQHLTPDSSQHGANGAASMLASHQQQISANIQAATLPRASLDRHQQLDSLAHQLSQQLQTAVAAGHMVGVQSPMTNLSTTVSPMRISQGQGNGPVLLSHDTMSAAAAIQRAAAAAAVPHTPASSLQGMLSPAVAQQQHQQQQQQGVGRRSGGMYTPRASDQQGMMSLDGQQLFRSMQQHDANTGTGALRLPTGDGTRPAGGASWQTQLQASGLLPNLSNNQNARSATVPGAYTNIDIETLLLVPGGMTDADGCRLNASLSGSGEMTAGGRSSALQVVPELQTIDARAHIASENGLMAWQQQRQHQQQHRQQQLLAQVQAQAQALLQQQQHQLQLEQQQQQKLLLLQLQQQQQQQDQHQHHLNSLVLQQSLEQNGLSMAPATPGAAQAMGGAPFSPTLAGAACFRYA